MTRNDERTSEQRVSHRWGVVARDKFMSGWGGAAGGASRCAWAVAEGLDLNAVERWVRSRPEMRHVNVVDLNRYRPPHGTAHFHVYVVNDGHPALKGA